MRGANLDKVRKPQWKKGQSGNPAGRPPKLPEIDVLLAKVLGEEKDGVTRAECILLALEKKAINGDVRASEVLLNRGWGMPKQKTEVEFTEARPVFVKPDGRKT